VDLFLDVIEWRGPDDAAEYDSPIDSLIRKIAEACPHEKIDWVEKYGAKFENDTFLMRPYCWCDESECLWCGGCECTTKVYLYFKDGVRISKEQHNAEWRDYAGSPAGDVYEYGTKAYRDYRKKWEAKINERNRRYTFESAGNCAYCTSTGLWSHPGLVKSFGMPNFWHKPSGFRVTWYKYIGRGMEFYGSTDMAGLLAMAADCIRSVKSNPVLPSDLNGE
jgi:hypothetical protein